MRRHFVLYLCLLLLVALPAATLAASLGEENVTLNSSGNFTITPVNSSQPYIVSNISVLGALQAASEAGGFNYTVIHALPPERGYLHIASIDGIENDVVNGTMMNWTYLLNGEQFTAGAAQKRVNDGDNVTFVYGSATDGQMMPKDTLTVFPTISDMTQNQTMDNVTQNQTMDNVTMDNVTQNQTMDNVTQNQTMDNVTQNQTMDNVTQNQTMDNVTRNMTIVDLIEQEQNLTMLYDAINTTNLTGTLSAAGPYTIFAPNDAAFEALGNDTANLTAVLQYHVVEGNYTSQQLMEMLQNQTMNQTNNMTRNQTANMTQNMTQQQNMTQTMNQTQNATVMLQTLLGQNLTISRNQSTGDLMVNNASVVQADLNASNGVVHVIDQVLIPQNMTENQTQNMTENQTQNMTENQTQNMTENQTQNMTENQTQNMTENQTMDTITPNITVTDQPIENGSVVISEAIAKRDNWVVIHAEQNDTPGPIIGKALISRGVNENVTVQIETENATETLYAMLHVDAGKKGAFEFPGSDRPETVMGEVVVQPFNVTGGRISENMTGNETMGNVTGMPNVTITMPENGSGVSAGNVTVAIEVANFSLVDSLGQSAVTGEGHVHYYMDVEPLPTQQGSPAVPENGSYAVSTNTSYTWENVTAGNHTFAVQLVNNDHTPLDPPVTAAVNVTANQTAENVTENQTRNMTQNQTMNETMNQTMNMTEQLQLYEGWNFIAIPKELADGNDTIEAVFQNVDTAGREVYRFTQAGGWETLDNDTTLEVLDAYWVYSNETTNVTVNFTSYPVNVPASKNLTQGWSGIGLSDTEPHTVNETLQSVEEDWVYLLGYDARNQSYETVIVNNAQGREQQMMPMKGYWLFMQEPGTLGALTA
ncbi:DUF4430 domain-containing protein [Methanoculleus sp. FWC-SCC1]|uniref:DUF4430 domain-containing protein n=1 Tax=Methanoculleus frigidifontis TaxID=2584085 RepID=A0ABT8M5U0_9EURY|nr:fasciclin domain-containing protein [Methanoculleus sp. FWC-SCC1]MDN7023305.1 DUF4430 domain-containing protein [Methanoculleus sp. FWC-SCC1]